MNYRHAFHAGNHADVLKHWTLALCLERLARKPTAFAVLDTHAGRGAYDLTSDAAVRSPEWRDGVGRLLDWSEAPPALAPYLALLRGLPAHPYPGSPAIAAAMLRPQDRLSACELHPEEVQALRRTLGADKRLQVHHRDGFEAMGALLPPPERRGLVLIDPPYEREDDFARSVGTLKAALDRFGHGVYLWWRPLKSRDVLARVDAELSQAGRPLLRADLAVSDPAASPRLTASSMLIVNPPFGLAENLAAAGPMVSERLALGPGARFDLAP